jgi:drug/metabolite transporter (DMT)-like permease
MIELWGLWLPMALVAPALWALVCILDLYFVQGAYRDEWDGTLISGAFQILPWLLVPLGLLPFTAPPAAAMLFALAGGGMFLASFFFYFRALFRHADAPLIEVLWSISVLVVPVMAWAWSDERLLPVHYLGIALAFLGSGVFAVRDGLLRQGFRRVAGPMVWAVLLLSASMVLQKEAYRITSGQFLDVYLIFSLGVVAAAALLALLNPKATLARIRRFAGFKPRYIALLVFAEGVSFVGTVFSQRAIDLSPSPSFVAAIESSVPVFVMLFSLLLGSAFAHLGREQTSTMFRNQMLGWQQKLLAIALMSSGIYCIAG